MSTDRYGQAVNIAGLVDAPDAAALAGNIVNAIVPKTVMQFASAAARTATLTGLAAPLEGMLSWLQDVDQLHIYKGGSWVQVVTGTTTTYTPTWSTNGSAPSIGNGLLSGTYSLIGKQCVVRLFQKWGSTTNSGTGIFQWSLPIAPVAGVDVSDGMAGSAYLGVGSGYPATALMQVGSLYPNKLILFGHTGAAQAITGLVPVTWVSGSYVVATLTYQVA